MRAQRSRLPRRDRQTGTRDREGAVGRRGSSRARQIIPRDKHVPNPKHRQRLQHQAESQRKSAGAKREKRLWTPRRTDPRGHRITDHTRKRGHDGRDSPAQPSTRSAASATLLPCTPDSARRKSSVSPNKRVRSANAHNQRRLLPLRQSERDRCPHPGVGIIQQWAQRRASEIGPLCPRRRPP